MRQHSVNVFLASDFSPLSSSMPRHKMRESFGMLENSSMHTCKRVKQKYENICYSLVKYRLLYVSNHLVTIFFLLSKLFFTCVSLKKISPLFPIGDFFFFMKETLHLNNAKIIIRKWWYYPWQILPFRQTGSASKVDNSSIHTYQKNEIKEWKIINFVQFGKILFTLWHQSFDNYFFFLASYFSNLS